jgi:eukaryotic-like serine/threonine-protein kinase
MSQSEETEDEQLPGADLPDDEWLQRVAAADKALQHGSIGRFEVLKEVARGGQGIVLKAMDPEMHRPVALKRLLAGRYATPRSRMRLEREMEIVASLQHPGIVTLHEYAEDDGMPMLVLEWIEGQPADEWAAEIMGDGRVHRILKTFMSACRAVQHAHQNGVIHRDLKPANILVDAKGEPHVLDFGIAYQAHEEDDRITRTREFVGSLAFAAPEQLDAGSREVDVRSDVYALAAILYLQLTGKLPVDTSRDPGTAAQSIREVPPSRPTTVDGRLPADLDNILLKALSKEPERRYPTVSAFIEDVQRLMKGEAVLAHPPSLAYSLKKSFQRRRAVFVLGAMLLLALIAFGVFFFVQSRRLSTLKTIAQAETQTAQSVLRLHQGFLRLILEREDQIKNFAAQAESAVLELARDPARLADALETIGVSQSELGDHVGSVRTLARALEEEEKAATLDLAAMASIRNHLAHSLSLTGQLERSGEVLENGIDRLQGSPLESVLLLQTAQIELLQLRGDFAAARQVMDARAGFREETTERDEIDDRILSTRLDLADMQFESAIGNGMGLVQECQKRFGVDAPMTALAHSNMGRIWLEAGAASRAEQSFRDAVRIHDTTKMRDHPDSVRSIVELCSSLVFQQKHQEAEPLLLEMLSILRSQDPRDYESESSALTDLGSLRAFDEKHEEAKGLLQQALATKRQRLGRKHPSVARTLVELGGAYSRMGEYDQAAEAMQEGYDILAELYGPRHRNLALSLNGMAVNARKSDQIDKAIELYGRALDLLLEHDPEGNQFVVIVLNNLAACNRKELHYEESREGYLRSLEFCDALGFPPNDVDRVIAICGLEIIRIQEASVSIQKAKTQDDIESAVATVRQAEEVIESILKSDDVLLQSVRNTMQHVLESAETKSSELD